MNYAGSFRVYIVSANALCYEEGIAQYTSLYLYLYHFSIANPFIAFAVVMQGETT